MPRSVSRPWLFECAWEVANKVGGIYTVIRTKAPVTVAEYGNRYILMGPLNYKSAPMEVESADPELVSHDLRDALHAMGQQGIRWKFGRWLIDGAPWVLLFDLGSAAHRLPEWRGDMASNHAVPSPPNDTETNDAILLGYLVSWLLGEFVHRETQHAIVAHFHEWQAGVALPLIRRRNFDITTIFTTHATLLGRYLCAGSVDFYNNLRNFDVDAESGRRGIYHRYCIERAAAHSALVFTTVSHITAYEAEYLLKRKPDGVVPNGLNVVKFAAVHEFQNLHAMAKEKIHDFVRGHFYGHLQDIDFDNVLYFFTAGRFEFRNKGVDMYLESLARLNHRLKSIGSKTTVVAFVIMPAATHSFTVETLKGHAVIKSLRDTVDSIQKQVGKRLFEAAARGETPDPSQGINGLLTSEELVTLKRRVYAMKRESLPPVVTHNMADDANDPVLNSLRRLHLFNSTHDRVKVVYHPEFLNANNPLFGLDYEEFVRGCHLGCTVMGVPSITTNLSGFGCYMEEIIETPDDYGIYIVDRRLKSVDESVDHLTEKMLSFTLKTRRQRINLRNRTERLADILDWKRLGLEYVKARHLALKRQYPDAFEQYRQGRSSAHGSAFGDSPVESLPRTPGEQPRVSRPLSEPGSPRTRHAAPHLMADEEAPEHVLEKLEQLGLAHDEDDEE
ncbi:glycogen synthase [Catenaria anguillulae PL171]|uniref:Glycogen [starch] synthase n=1 Tax=Catenaria anguillulae PL171 TaxID=765915 RepID=A0A1Y2HJF1_9FUNG|nr:glycogen synthase [Catenaria anguillulae PL171]